MMFGRLPVVAVLGVLALLAAACGGGAASTETTAETSSPTTAAVTPTATATTIATTTTATEPPTTSTTAVPAVGLAWVRVLDDEAVFGGPESQAMQAVVVGGSGLVAVGLDGFGSDDWDAAVWVSADGLVWSRVPHDEAVFGGPSGQAMTSVVVGGPGLVAVGLDISGDDWNAAVWTSTDGLAWSRVPHDETAVGSPGGQPMWEAPMQSVVVGGPGLVAVGLGVSGDFWDAVVWVSPPSG